MILSLVCTVMLGAPGAVTSQEPTPSEWAARLGGEQRDAARAELLAMGRGAAPILAGVVEVGENEAGWQAVRILRQLGKDGTSSRAKLEDLLEDAELPSSRRALAALGLGAVGPKNASAAKALAKALEDRPEAQLSVAVRVSLAQLGKPAAKSAAGLLKKDDVILEQYGAQVLYVLGPEAAGEKRTLIKVIEDDDGYLLYGIAKLALERMGKPASKDLARAWTKREEVLPRQKGLGGMPPMVWDDVEQLMVFLREKRPLGMEGTTFPTERIPPVREMSLPEFYDFNQDGYPSAGEVCLVWAEHLAIELDALVQRLAGQGPDGDAPDTYAAWRELALPIERSSEGLETFEWY